MKDSIKRRKLRAKFASAAAKAATKAEVKRAEEKAKTLRGAGVSVASFACMIVFCRLRPFGSDLVTSRGLALAVTGLSG